MGNPFNRGDTGDSSPGRYTFRPSASTGEQAIPGKCRYFKISASTALTVRLRLDVASGQLWAQQGTNIEDVGWIYNANAVSSLILTFHG